MLRVSRQSLIFTFFAFLFLAWLSGASASPAHIDIILVKHLALPDIANTNLPHLFALRETGQMALVSPGSPRPPDPVANAYATFTAGDVVNTKNPHAGLLQRTLKAAGAGNRVTIIDFGDAGGPGRLQAFDTVLDEQKSADRLMVCSVVPPQDARGGWDRLTVVLISGPGMQPGATLTSDTTHTSGLVALRDIAPTILSWADVPIPPSMTGAPIEVVAVPHRAKLLAHLDRLTLLNQHILLPLAWFLGWFGGMAVFGTVASLAARKRVWPAGLRYLLRSAIAFPLAALLAPAANPQTVAQYALLIIGFDLVLALIPSAGVLCALTAGVLVIDGFTGAHLVAQTALSGYWLPGIRFYGIGNEYMGVFLGAALMAPTILLTPEHLTPRSPSLRGEFKAPPKEALSSARKGEPTVPGSFSDHSALTTIPAPPVASRRARQRIPGGEEQAMRSGGVGLALWFLLVLVALSFPAFGAKAGGAVTAMVCFAPVWFAVALGRRIGWVSFVLSALAGFAVIFIFAAVSHALGLRETHIQAASAAVGAGRLGYIWHIALRKAKMAVKIFLHPGVFLTLIGLAVTYLIWRRSHLPHEMKEFLARRPRLTTALRAGAWGILACVLFNDSGTVAAFFLLGVMLLSFLHEMLRPTPAISSAAPAASGANAVVATKTPLSEEQRD